ncbi:putative mediator of RNA polymerase II transcription subunit 15 isoform X1 [Nymphalis io]|uniref:putative mediator of RNA polymerase II transcription subunit 15 isoform X1 n=1 Tax=Inachis io TaxID=171585 RepID=UPI00216778AF|nr:putative mediator of RNA polymerase II transcription subunit 15 isoform X1 [Nymphalis io]
MEQTDIDNSVIVKEVTDSINSTEKSNSTEMDTGRVLGLLPIFILILIMFIRIIFVIYKSNGQKTRNSQQRRTYMGSRQRPSDSQSEPTVYVSPANLPPPPKYEAMAPPSYDEVVGTHYPSFQPPVQPITQPITAALAQSSNSTNNEHENSANSNVNAVPNNVNGVPNNVNGVPSNVNTVPNNGNVRNVVPSTVITVNPDERTTVTVAAS